MVEWGQMDKPLRDLIEIIHFTENVSTKIHGVLDEAEIYRTVKKEFTKSKRYTASILLLTDDESALRVAETSALPGKLKATEKATGLRLRGYKIELNKSSIYSQVVRGGRTIQVNANDILGELFPRPLARLISETMGYEKRPAILTPLKRHGEIIGALATTSTELAEHFIPSVRNLAQHISTALELADEYAERKRAEEALRESEGKFHKLARAVEQSPSTVVITDTQGNIEYVNPRFTQLTGYTANEVLGQNPRLLKSGKQPSEFYEELWDTILTGEEWQGEFCNREKSGELYWELASISPIRNAEGVITHFVKVAEDITERKQAEEALRESEEKFRQFFENEPEYCYMVSPEGVILDVNSAALKALGYRREEIIGKPLKMIYAPESLPKMKRLFVEWEKTGHLRDEEMVILTRKGDKRTVLLSAGVVKDRDGKILYSVSVQRDITKRKRAEEERERLILELQDALAKVKTLSGLLPICASCKKIRDDAGYWSQLETYIQEHSEAEFSHGICPECAKKLYPEFFGDDE